MKTTEKIFNYEYDTLSHGLQQGNSIIVTREKNKQFHCIHMYYGDNFKLYIDHHNIIVHSVYYNTEIKNPPYHVLKFAGKYQKLLKLKTWKQLEIELNKLLNKRYKYGVYLSRGVYI